MMYICCMCVNLALYIIYLPYDSCGPHILNVMQKDKVSIFNLWMHVYMGWGARH